jgi:hypothetical protein
MSTLVKGKVKKKGDFFSVGVEKCSSHYSRKLLQARCLFYERGEIESFYLNQKS